MFFNSVLLREKLWEKKKKKTSENVKLGPELSQEEILFVCLMNRSCNPSYKCIWNHHIKSNGPSLHSFRSQSLQV